MERVRIKQELGIEVSESYEPQGVALAQTTARNTI